jgi:hypothetical protein
MLGHARQFPIDRGKARAQVLDEVDCGARNLLRTGGALGELVSSGAIDIGVKGGRQAERVRQRSRDSLCALLAQAEALQQIVVTREVVPLQIIEQLATTAREGEKATAGMEILPVGPEVFGQVADARRKERYLNFTRSGVLLVDFVLSDDFLFFNCF